jgi:hypothetical protein
MSEDWVDDETMSREETLARFEALNPELARGPRVPAGGYVVSSIPSFSQGKMSTTSGALSIGSALRVTAQPASA